jgi:hypothetical protein
MNLQTEVYISIDGLEYNKLDLAKNEAIRMKYVLKDTTDLSKIFSPFSLSFTFPGTLHNQKSLGFVGDTKVVKIKTDNIFHCKVYSNGLLFQTGKLKLTEVRYDEGVVQTFTANFTTTMLSLTTRMGEDLINNLPDNPVKISWLPNDVFNSVSSVQLAATEPIDGIVTKYYTPLISRNRIFQRRLSTANFLDNVAYLLATDVNGTETLKSSELRPAVQGRTIIDMIKVKYNLDIVMPLESTQEYNDWYVYCNAEIKESNTLTTVGMVSPLSLTIVESIGADLPPTPRYVTSLNLATDEFTVTIDNYFPNNERWGGDFQLQIRIDDILILDGSDTSDFLMVVKRDDGRVLYTSTNTPVGDVLDVTINITDEMFLSGVLKFKIEIQPKQTSSWSNMAVGIVQEYFDHVFHHRKFQYLSATNNNSSASGGGVIDLFKSIPEMKCTDFLNNFFKTFNISVFDASPGDDKLFWLTPNDLLTGNTNYAKKVVDYTPYIVSKAVTKTIAADFNYYNFKHKTTKYKSNVDYLAAHGVEFGQTTYPSIRPTENLNEFKVETGFSIIEAVPIAGMTDEFTSYGFTSDPPEVLDGGELRYKPNTEDLTMFFACGLRNLVIPNGFSGNLSKCLAFQKTNSSGVLVIAPLKSYVKTSPVHPNGFSFGFSLIQEAVIRSLYYDFYRVQTERLLSPNTLNHSYKLRLPASELVLNFATTTSGMAIVPDGFRLQNEIILQENRFSLIDAQIDITTGDATMNLLNFI